MEKCQIAVISALETHPLRSLVLRNRDARIPCPFDGDLDDTTHHFASFYKHEIVTIASFYLRQNELLGNHQMLQLRGMAAHPNYAGMGFGKDLMRFTMEYFKNQGIEILWCNAREVAFGFYQKLGFKSIGDNFKIPEIGVHRVMYVNLKA